MSPRLTPRRGRTWWNRSIVRLLLIGAAAVIVVDALVGDQGVLAVRRARRQSQELETKVARKSDQNMQLLEQKQRLLDDHATIEDAARRLGLIRRGEKVFILKDAPSPTP